MIPFDARSSFAEWVETGDRPCAEGDSNNCGIEYIDREHITTNGSSAVFWTLIDWQRPSRQKSIRQTLRLNQIDCAVNRLSIVERYAYFANEEFKSYKNLSSTNLIGDEKLLLVLCNGTTATTTKLWTVPPASVFLLYPLTGAQTESTALRSSPTIPARPPTVASASTPSDRYPAKEASEDKCAVRIFTGQELSQAKKASATLSPKGRAAARDTFRDGFDLYKKGEPDAAGRLFAKGLAVDPANGQAHFYYGEVLILLEQIPSAAEQFAWAKALSSSSKDEVLAESRLSGLKCPRI